MPDDWVNFDQNNWEWPLERPDNVPSPLSIYTLWTANFPSSSASSGAPPGPGASSITDDIRHLYFGFLARHHWIIFKTDNEEEQIGYILRIVASGTLHVATYPFNWVNNDRVQVAFEDVKQKCVQYNDIRVLSHILPSVASARVHPIA